MNVRKTTRARRGYSAQEKCKAVLAVWTGQRRVGQIIRELKLPPGRLAVWQRQALEGMLHALEPRRKGPEPNGPMLEGKVAKLWTRVLAKKQVKLRPEAPSPEPLPDASR